MLILTRRSGESIVIGDNVTVTIVEAGRDHVRVGIDAPRSVSVHREEVYAAISRENEAASAGSMKSSTAVSAVSAAAMPRRPRKPV